MGLSASQARLLSITARVHDIESSAQNIMNQKVELATLEDAAYEEYCDALDAKKIKVAYSNGSTTKYADATFLNVCTFDESGNRRCQYALTDSVSGKMLVEQDVFVNYNNYSNDKYSFAWAMLGFDEDGEYSDFSWSDNWGNNIGFNAGDGDEAADGRRFMLMTDAEEIAFENLPKDSVLITAYNAYKEALKSDDIEKQKDTLYNFRNLLYSSSKTRAEIYDIMCLDKTRDRKTSLEDKRYKSGFPTDFNENMNRRFEYYVRLFEGIEKAGGCMPVSDYDGFDISDNECFSNMVNSGTVVLNMYDSQNPEKGWCETSVATSINENYLDTALSEIDIKKAEAKYQHKLDKVKKKDAQFDKDLQVLESERTALTKEMDSLKKVKNDNIERTFGIFS